MPLFTPLEQTTSSTSQSEHITLTFGFETMRAQYNEGKTLRDYLCENADSLAIDTKRVASARSNGEIVDLNSVPTPGQEYSFNINSESKGN